MRGHKGTFITLDGPEGAGKSTQARLLVRALTAAGIPVIALHEPGSTYLGKQLRRLLLKAAQPLTPMSETLLFWAARVQLLHEFVEPALKAGRVVVCDRYHDATVAYQGYGGSLDADWVDRTGRTVIGQRLPHVTFLFDLPVEMGFARLRRLPDRMERKALSFHRRVRQGYLALAEREPQRIVRLDAAQPKALLQQQILAVLLKRLRSAQHGRLLSTYCRSQAGHSQPSGASG
jgi:dTMP kinase